MADDAAGRKGRFTVKFHPDTGSEHQADDGETGSIGNHGNHDSDVRTNHYDPGREEESLHDVTDDSSSHSKHKDNLYLYEEDMKRMPKVSTFLKTVMMSGTHTTYPSEREEKEAKQKPKKAKLGMMLGVYLPTIQHILGLLMFIRHGWITGCSGVLETCFMVFFCCLTTFVTSISLSAIATNGMVQGGGSYYMLSRNLGPECGGSIGICFYLANALATCMYLLGAIEILLVYMAPSLAYFGDIHDDPWNNFRVYGTVFMILLTLIVAIGVKFVAFFAPISLACVILSIISIVVGAALANSETKDVWVCLLGDRLLKTPYHWDPSNISIEQWCTKNITGDIWHRYCSIGNESTECDSYFSNNDVRYISAIPGVASGVIERNAFSYYLGKGEVTPGVEGDRHRGEIVSDMTTNFVYLCAIYFPSVTGILTGANMSGDLRDPQKSLPSGTILAQLTCSFVYILLVLLYGSTVEGVVLRDKFGGSLGGQLVAALLCWPNPWVVLIGAFTSSFGAALQCLTSAPRLLQAIARDDIIPFLRIFKETNCNGEPQRALILSFFIAEIGVIIANIDLVAPVIDVFFLMCYLFVNLICALQTLLKTPNWRPRFKYYHWTLSVLGVILNFALCIIAGWYYALAAFVIAGFIYKYIEYKGGEKEWGDGISGLTMATAQRALLSLDDEPHTKNWRPQILVLTKLDVSQEQPVEHIRFFNLAGQLKAGRGLTILATVLEGDLLERSEEASRMQTLVKEMMKIEKVKGFAKVMVTPTATEGLRMLVQTVGLGGMRHNSVMIGWPNSWHRTEEETSWKVFLDTVRAVEAQGLALLVPRGIENFPDRKTRLTGTIDVWWIVHDGGMLILLAFLLRQSKVWKGCRIRIFTVAHLTDNSIQIKKDLEEYLYQIRIKAEVHVEEMYEGAITAYTVEKTLDMERRAKLLEEMKNSQLRRSNSDPHHHHHHHHHHHLPHLPRRLSHSRRISLVNSPEEVIQLSRQQTPETAGGVARKGSATKFRRSIPHGENDKQQRSDSLVEDMRAPVTPTTPTIVEPFLNEDELEPVEEDMVHFTFTASASRAKMVRSQELAQPLEKTQEEITDSEGRLLRMHTAVQLNQSIKSKSSEAQIVIVNFPAPPAKNGALENYMEYLEVLSEGLERVLMVRGSGKEVVTMYS